MINLNNNDNKSAINKIWSRILDYPGVISIPEIGQYMKMNSHSVHAQLKNFSPLNQIHKLRTIKSAVILNT